jgi:hypothetical protein
VGLERLPNLAVPGARPVTRCGAASASRQVQICP